MVQTLQEVIAWSEKNKKAIGHFNISTIEALWGIFNAAREYNVPVIIGVSEGERAFLGVRQTAALIQSIREEFDYPIFLNADHTYSFEKAKEAIDAGYDSIIFDGAMLSLEENINETKRSVLYAKEVSKNRSTQIMVEGELGYIGKSSEILDKMPVDVSDAGMTVPTKAARFVKETGVHLFAPAVGNIHGMLRNIKNPDLDVENIKRIKKAVGVPLVLHGGSGTSDNDFKKAIQAGVSIIHINTEIRAAWRSALENALQEDRDTVAPYKILKNSREAVRKVVLERLKLFNL